MPNKGRVFNGHEQYKQYLEFRKVLHTLSTLYGADYRELIEWYSEPEDIQTMINMTDEQRKKSVMFFLNFKKERERENRVKEKERENGNSI